MSRKKGEPVELRVYEEIKLVERAKNRKDFIKYVFALIRALKKQINEGYTNGVDLRKRRSATSKFMRGINIVLEKKAQLEKGAFFFDSDFYFELFNILEDFLLLLKDFINITKKQEKMLKFLFARDHVSLISSRPNIKTLENIYNVLKSGIRKRYQDPENELEDFEDYMNNWYRNFGLEGSDS